jgi:menaquinone-dependent protoporphyrinogen IX oxidase
MPFINEEKTGMTAILVAYATNAGSTEEVAKAVAEELGKNGAQATVRRIDEVSSLEGYDAVVVGAPMIMGWHRGALAFLRRNRQVLGRAPLALFVTCMSLTRTGESSEKGIPVFVDEKLACPPRREGRLSLRERYATVTNYLAPILRAAPAVKPVSVAFFGGSLQYFKLKWWAVLFALLIIQAQPGDKRNWDAIAAWAGSLFAQEISK